MSPLAILLVVITGPSSNSASPTSNSNVKTPKDYRSTFSLYNPPRLRRIIILGGR